MLRCFISKGKGSSAFNAPSYSPPAQLREMWPADAEDTWIKASQRKE